MTRHWCNSKKYSFGVRNWEKYSGGLEKNRAEIEKWCVAQASGSGIKVRKTMLKGKQKEVEEALFLWHEHLRGKVPVTGPILQEKALEFKRQIEGQD